MWKGKRARRGGLEVEVGTDDTALALVLAARKRPATGSG